MAQQDNCEAGWVESPDGGAVFEETSDSCRAIPMVDDRLDSKDLFAASRLITIAHGEQTYQLRLTAQNKLILTK